MTLVNWRNFSTTPRKLCYRQCKFLQDARVVKVIGSFIILFHYKKKEEGNIYTYKCNFIICSHTIFDNDILLTYSNLQRNSVICFLRGFLSTWKFSMHSILIKARLTFIIDFEKYQRQLIISPLEITLFFFTNLNLPYSIMLRANFFIKLVAWFMRRSRRCKRFKTDRGRTDKRTPDKRDQKNSQVSRKRLSRNNVRRSVGICI